MHQQIVGRAFFQPKMRGRTILSTKNAWLNHVFNQKWLADLFNRT